MIPAALLLAGLAAAQETPPPEEPRPASAVEASTAAPAGSTGAAERWVRQASSLLRFDAAGDLAEEVGLGRWEEAGASGPVVRELRGDASPGGAFAWTFEKKTSWNPSKTKILQVERHLRFLGRGASELWSAPEADAPTSGEPVVFSADGETILVALRRSEGWTISARSYIGNTLAEAGPFASLTATALSPGGRFALARWTEVDKSATHTFLNVSTKKRTDLASEAFLLGPAELRDDGKVYSGAKMIVDLAAPAAPAP